MTGETLLALVVGFPLLGAVFNGFFGRFHGRRLAGYLACGAMAMAFLSALGAVKDLAGLDPQVRTIHKHLYTWIDASTFKVDMALTLDPLSAVMILVVTGVGFLIHVYSIGYMAHDDGRVRYFTYLNLFVFFMLMLVLGSSLPVMFLGWEGVGLCSYLLIGFWFDDIAKAVAGKKAFLVNRIGDMFFVLGMFLLFWTYHAVGSGSLAFADMQANAELIQAAKIGGVAVTSLAAFCLFLGATGKSAQIPLFVWLPDAMAGPTPVSALIHAATMVTAGVYMVARMNFLFEMSPGVMSLVAWVGALTALFAATIGMAATDIKKVLAYSTISQLGYMFVAVGVGSYVAGIFHLVTHAFFKGLLFLGAGSVIHGVTTQDIRQMGGVRHKMPWTFWTFLVGTWAIAGLPPFAGFFSKDEILFHAYAGPHGSVPLWFIGYLTGAMTAFYMFRLFALVFLGKTRMSKKEYGKVHESPATMTVPLAILAGLSAIGGLMGLPHAFHMPHLLGDWLAPVFPEFHVAAGAGTELGLMAASVAAAIAGSLLALYFYFKKGYVPVPDNGKASLPASVARDKFYIDEVYDGLVVMPMKAIARFLSATVDAAGVDRVASGWLPGLAGWISKGVTALQNGNTQRYAMALFAGAVALIVYVSLFGVRVPLA